MFAKKSNLSLEYWSVYMYKVIDPFLFRLNQLMVVETKLSFTLNYVECWSFNYLYIAIYFHQGNAR